MKHKILKPVYYEKSFKLFYDDYFSRFNYRNPFSTGYENIPVNIKTMGRIACKLHYLACHSPKPIASKWKPVMKRFERQHLGNFENQSFRFHLKLAATHYF